MRKSLVILFTVVLLASMVFAGTGCKPNTPAPTNAPAGTAAPTVNPDAAAFKVGFIYVGPVGDGGYTYAQDLGRKYLAEKLGVTTVFAENVAEGAKSKDAIENFIKQGCKVIFTTSFGYMDPTAELAEKYPEVIFEHCSGFKMNDKNFGNYFGREYQARYLAGIAAGKATTTKKIGYVAAFPIPECIRGINAFTLGVRSVNPDATVNVVWTRTWYDPQIEKQSAEGLLDAGCDVMAQHQDTTEPVAAAEAKGAFSTGYNSPMGAKAPKGYLTSPIWNWGPHFVAIVDSAMKGTYKPQAYWGGLETETIMLDAFGPSVTQETKDLITAKSDAMKKHEWDVFTGPIKDQTGAVKIAEGAKMTDGEMLGMMWFVEGVIGKPE